MKNITFENILKFLFEFYPEEDFEMLEEICNVILKKEKKSNIDFKSCLYKQDFKTFEEFTKIVQETKEKQDRRKKINKQETNKKLQDFIDNISKVYKLDFNKVRQFGDNFYCILHLLNYDYDMFNKYADKNLIFKMVDKKIKDKKIRQSMLRLFIKKLDYSKQENIKLYKIATAKLFKQNKFITIDDRYRFFIFFCKQNNIDYKNASKFGNELTIKVEKHMINMYKDIYSEALNICKKELLKKDYSEKQEIKIKNTIAMCYDVLRYVLTIYPYEEREQIQAEFMNKFNYNKMLKDITEQQKDILKLIIKLNTKKHTIRNRILKLLNVKKL